MMEFLKLYGIAVVVFLGIDGVWLTLIAKNFYAKHLGYLMTNTPNLLAALIFYLLNVVGITALVLLPSLKGNDWFKPLLLAGIYGLCTYATYDLTNLATIKNWPVIVTVVDLIWGVFLTMTVVAISLYLGRKFI